MLKHFGVFFQSVDCCKRKCRYRSCDTIKYNAIGIGLFDVSSRTGSSINALLYAISFVPFVRSWTSTCSLEDGAKNLLFDAFRCGVEIVVVSVMMVRRVRVCLVGVNRWKCHLLRLKCTEGSFV